MSLTKEEIITILFPDNGRLHEFMDDMSSEDLLQALKANPDYSVTHLITMATHHPDIAPQAKALIKEIGQ